MPRDRLPPALRDPTADAALRAVVTRPAFTALALAFRDALARPWRSAWVANLVWSVLAGDEAEA